MNRCAHLDFQAADEDLNLAYRMARDYLRVIDADLPDDMKGGAVALRDAQRAWIKYRDHACSAEGFVFRGGTIEPLIISSCMARLTRQRTEDLRALAEVN